MQQSYQFIEIYQSPIYKPINELNCFRKEMIIQINGKNINFDFQFEKHRQIFVHLSW